MLAVVVSKRWPIHHYDGQNAFLHGPFTETIFMALPLGFNPQYLSHVCRLHKAHYGLCQSPRAWYFQVSSILVYLGFNISTADPSLFIHSHGSIFVLVYVDELLITRSSFQSMSNLVLELCREFPITNLGSLKFFLGIEASFNTHDLLLTQQKYITDFLKKTNMHLAKSVKTPMASTNKLSAYSGDLFDNPTLYRSTIGLL